MRRRFSRWARLCVACVAGVAGCERAERSVARAVCDPAHLGTMAEDDRLGATTITLRACVGRQAFALAETDLDPLDAARLAVAACEPELLAVSNEHDALMLRAGHPEAVGRRLPLERRATEAHALYIVVSARRHCIAN